MLNFFKNAGFDGGELHFTAPYFGTLPGQAFLPKYDCTTDFWFTSNRRGCNLHVCADTLMYSRCTDGSSNPVISRVI